MMLLNLGAGIKIWEGENVVNHDIVQHSPAINAVWDLNETPWPWETNQFVEIHFYAVIEHLKLTPIESLNECHRILKPGGELRIRYPLFSSPNYHDDPTHRWPMSEKSLDYVDPRTVYGSEYHYYTPLKWHILERGIVKDRNVVARLTPLK
jgi:predicted SAM-dependent methyltransferase